MKSSIVQSLESVARQAPTAPALAWHSVRWTYADLQRAVDAVAACLHAQGLARGDRVALLARNSPQYVAFYYGTLAAGGVAVPLNTQERAVVLARQIAHCGARLLLGDPAHPEWGVLSASVTAAGLRVQAHALAQDAEALPKLLGELGEAPACRAGSATADDLASLIYTSGTTGQPKGVMLSHGNLAANAGSIIEYLGLSARDRGLCVLPFHFSYGNSVLHSHLLSGASLLLEDNFAFPHIVLQRIQDEGITGFSGVPSTFALLLGRCRLQDFDLRRLRYVTQAGGAMARPLIESLRAQLPGASLFIMYGQTEATARLSYLPPEKLTEKLGSVGIAIPGVELDVRSEGRTVPAGEIGEICARGANVMLGYWDNPEATAAVLRDGWLHTGDLGHRDADGYFFIDGRAVEMIKVGAFRVSPQEVEEVIAALPGVEETGVTAVTDELLGQAIKAVVVPRPGASLDVREVKAHCRRELASYKVPKIVEFASVLPRTSSGKIQRFKLV